MALKQRMNLVNKKNTDMLKLRVNEAIARSQDNGKKVFKHEVSAKLWPNSSQSAQQVNMTNLCNGTTKKISIDFIEILCDTLDCTPNYLFGYE